MENMMRVPVCGFPGEVWGTSPDCLIWLAWPCSRWACLGPALSLCVRHSVFTETLFAGKVFAVLFERKLEIFQWYRELPPFTLSELSWVIRKPRTHFLKKSFSLPECWAGSSRVLINRILLFMERTNWRTSVGCLMYPYQRSNASFIETRNSDLLKAMNAHIPQSDSFTECTFFRLRADFISSLLILPLLILD